MLTCHICNARLKSKDSLANHLKWVHAPNQLSFPCERCDKSFKYKGGLTDHMRRVHADDPTKHVCQVCNKSYSTVYVLKHHINDKHPGHQQPMHACGICMVEFPTLSDLRCHLRSEHPEPMEKHVCNMCDKNFSSRQLLRAHVVLVHEKTKQVECEICKKSFCNMATLRRHKKLHNKMTAVLYSCSFCDYKAVLKSYVDKHMKHVHSDEGKLGCMKCSAMFRTDIALKRHMWRTHKDPEIIPFECKQCHYHCMSEEDLERHVNIKHKKMTPHVCHLCDKAFSSYSSLNMHQHVHSEERGQICTICNTRFKTVKGLKTHIQNQHKVTRTHKPLKCDECGKGFTRMRNLEEHRNKQHLRVNLFDCTECNKKFASRGLLKEHMYCHDKSKHVFKCPTCPLAFHRQKILERHVEIVHLGVKKFACDVCDFKCSDSRRLAKHKKSWHTEEGMRYMKKQEQRIADILNRASIAYSREYAISFSCINGMQRYARVDFLIVMHDVICLLEVDEGQHKEYALTCELNRMNQIHEMFTMNANTMPILFIRYNPHAYNVDGFNVRTPKKYREARLIEYLQFDLQKLAAKGNMPPMSITYMFYDTDTHNGVRVPVLHDSEEYYGHLKQITNEPIILKPI